MLLKRAVFRDGFLLAMKTVLVLLSFNVTLLQSVVANPLPKPPGLHSGYTSTLLNNGTLLVAGGSTGNRILSDSMLYNPLTGTWTNTGAMSIKRFWHVAALMSDGRVMVAGGESGGDHSQLATAEIYDPTTGKWITTGSLSFERLGHQLTMLADGKILATGGMGDKAKGNHTSIEFNIYSGAELYDPATGKWTLTKPMNEARYGHAAVLLTNGMVLVAGGRDKQANFLFSVELYDPAKDTWTTTGPMPRESRFTYATTLLTNGEVMFEASDPNAWEASKLLYDPPSGGWKMVGSPRPHFVSSTNLDRTLGISLESGSSYLASQVIQFWIGSADRFGVSNIDLFRDGIKIGEHQESPWLFTLTNQASGTYTFLARAAFANGMASTSAPVTVTFKASEPEVSLAPGPTEFISETHVKSSPAILLASVVGVNPGSLTKLTLNGVEQPLQTGDFTLHPPLVEGKNVFVLAAADKQGRTGKATTEIYLDSNLPLISITEPANNASINAMCVDVRGTFKEKNLKQISVNQMPAFIYNNTFEVRSVFLRPGTNVIFAIAENIAGNAGSNSITVIGPTDTNTAQTFPVQIEATPAAGFAPLQVIFKVQAHVPGKIQHVYYNFEGQPFPEQIAASAQAYFPIPRTTQPALHDSEGENAPIQTKSDLRQVKHTYATDGEFFPFVTIQTDVGRFSSQLGGMVAFFSAPRFVNVQSPPVLLSTIKIQDPVDLKWTGASNLYVLSGSTGTITEFGPNGRAIRTLKGIHGSPSGFDVDPDGNLYVAARGSNQVWKFKPTDDSFQVDNTFGNGGFIGNKDGSSGSRTNELDAPFDVTVTPDFGGRKILVSDGGNNRIERFDKNGLFSSGDGFHVGKNGQFISSFGEKGTNQGQLSSPKGIAVNAWEELAIVDSENNRIVIADNFGTQKPSGDAGSALGQFQGPWNISLGERGLYVADTGNNRVQAFGPLDSHELSSNDPLLPRFSISGELGLNHPKAVAAVRDAIDEMIYIADTGNNRVILVKLPAETPERVWDAMKARLVANDIPGALTHFSVASKEAYQQAFNSMSKSDLQTTARAMKAIKAASIESDEAQYYFEDTIEGKKITFPIKFVRENGQWKIAEY